MTRVALDSNILVYIAGVAHVAADKAKIEDARAVVQKLSAASVIAPVQALGELFVVLRRSGVAAAKARDTVVDMLETFATPASEPRTARAAADLVVDHKLQFWDAMIVAAAVDAGCTLLLSEDMQHGFVTRGLTIVNPLADETHPKLMAILKEQET